VGSIYEGYEKIGGFIKMEDKKLCACGCGKEIIWKPYMKYQGIPKYLIGHHFKGKTYEEMYGLEGSKKKKESTSKGNKGKILSEKTKRKQSLAKKGKTWEEIMGKQGAYEFRKKRKQTYKDNPEIKKNAIKKMLQTYKDNPEKRINAEKKKQGTLKSNPDIIKQQFKKRKQTYKDNPEIQKSATKKFKQTLKSNPEIKEQQVKKRRQTFKDNPEIEIERIKKRRQTFKDNPEIEIRRIKRFKQTHKEYPEIKRKQVRDMMLTRKNNPHIEEQRVKKISAIQQGIELKDWKKFISKEPYDQNWTPQFRRAIRKRDNQICMLCGIHREKLNRALDVHHFNYNKKMSLHQNCVSLCNLCHLKTNGNRKHWTKFFQSLLTEKYGYQYGENQEVIINLEEEKNE